MVLKMKERITVEQLKSLVVAFDDEVGLPQSVYFTVYDLVAENLGTASGVRFCQSMKVKEGRYYLTKDSGEEVWDKIINLK